MLQELNRADFEKVYALMDESFPPDEHRPCGEQKALLDDEAYRILVLHAPDGEVQGFFAVWEFDAFLFVEHFAVNPAFRNGGVGSKMLAELLETAGKPVCLEVELPETEMARRRIGFYQRSGFVLNPYPYIQPSISAGRNPLPLAIMSAPRAIGPEEFEEFRRLVYARVYKQG